MQPETTPAERELRERCLELAVRADAANALSLAAAFIAFVKDGLPKAG